MFIRTYLLVQIVVLFGIKCQFYSHVISTFYSISQLIWQKQVRNKWSLEKVDI